MQNLKTIVFVAGALLLILAAVIGCLSIKNLAGIRSADSYEDKGVYTFSPYKVQPVQEKNTGASGRDRRELYRRTAEEIQHFFKSVGGIPSALFADMVCDMV